MKFKMNHLSLACLLSLAIAAAPVHAAEAGLLDRIKAWWNGSSEAAPANAATGELAGAQLVATESQAKALCDDMQSQVKAAQDSAIAARMPPRSPSQVINDDYGVLDVLNTPIDIGGLISGGISGLMGDITKKLASTFVNGVVVKAQDSFRKGINDTLGKYEAPAIFQGTVDRAVAGVNGTAGSVINAASQSVTDQIYGAGKSATSGVNSAVTKAISQANTVSTNAANNSAVGTPGFVKDAARGATNGATNTANNANKTGSNAANGVTNEGTRNALR